MVFDKQAISRAYAKVIKVFFRPRSHLLYTSNRWTITSKMLIILRKMLFGEREGRFKNAHTIKCLLTNQACINLHNCNQVIKYLNINRVC